MCSHRWSARSRRSADLALSPLVTLTCVSSGRFLTSVRQRPSRRRCVVGHSHMCLVVQGLLCARKLSCRCVFRCKHLLWCHAKRCHDVSQERGHVLQASLVSFNFYRWWNFDSLRNATYVERSTWMTPYVEIHFPLRQNFYPLRQIGDVEGFTLYVEPPTWLREAYVEKKPVDVINVVRVHFIRCCP